MAETVLNLLILQTIISTMNTICIDIGNYSVLSSVVGSTDTTPVKIWRSLIYDTTNNGTVRDGLHRSDSPLVGVNGKYFKLGHQASRQPGCLSAAEAGKNQPDIFLPMLLAATPDGFDGEVSMLVPKRDSNAETWIRTAVLGQHEYSVDKVGRSASITNINFEIESETALLYAFITGLVPSDTGVLLIDIGGGTVNAVASTFCQGHLDIIWRNSYDNSGGIALASAIANTDHVKAQKTMNKADIMDAIAMGKRYICNRPDRSFEPVFDDCLRNWFKAIRTTILSDADSSLSYVTHIVWMGGAAELLRPQLQGKEGQIVFPQPQYANINALIHLNGGDIEKAA